MEDFLEMITYYITYPKINKMIRVTLLSILLIIMVIVGLKWVNMPVKLSVGVVPNTEIYVNEDLKSTSFYANITSVSGSTSRVDKPAFKAVKDEDTGDFLVTVYAGGMFETIKVIPIGVRSVTARYNGTELHSGFTVSKDNVRVSVEFNNGRIIDSVPFECQLPTTPITEYCEFPVSTEYGDTTLVLSPVVINTLDIDYVIPEGEFLCAGDLFDSSKVKASVTFGDGVVRDISNFTVRVEAQHRVFDAETLRVNTPYGEGKLYLDPLPLIEQTVTYNRKLFEKDYLDPSAVELVQTFGNDGVVKCTRTITDWTVEGYSVINRINVSEGMNLTFVTPVAKTKFTPSIVALENVKMYQKNGAPLFAGDVPDPDYFEISYSDGTVVSIKAKDVNMDPDSWSEPVGEGLNRRTFMYYAKNYDVDMYGLKELQVQSAKDLLVNEIDNAEAKYVSDNIIVTVRSGVNEDMTYKLAHVIINSPLQIKGGLSNDVYGGSRETPTSASQRQKWVVGINASVFDYDTGGLDTSVVGTIIKNHEIMEDSGTVTTGQEVLLLDDGMLVTPMPNMTIEDLMSQYAVKDSFGSRDVVLISEGMRVNENLVSDSIPRTAIGMVRPGEYYLLVASGEGYTGGGTYHQVREVLWDVGCVYAKCLDGGSSSSMVFNGALVNTPASGVERAVADYLYFVDIGENSVLSTLDYFTNDRPSYQQYDYSLYNDVGNYNSSDEYLGDGYEYNNDAVVIIG